MNPWTQLLLAITFVFVLVTSGVCADVDAEPDVGQIISERDRARARYEASQASLETLKQQREEAASKLVAARKEEYMAGRFTSDGLYEVERLLLQARSPLRTTESTPRPVLEDAWNATYFIAVISKAKFEAGQVSPADYYRSLYYLRDAEISLALTRPKK